MVSRLFQIVYILMEKPYITASELATRLEVSERTIYRDVDKLSSAGIPIYTNRGKGGGISLLPDFVLDKMVLTEEEKAKISHSLQAFSALGYEDEKQVVANLQNFFGAGMQDWIEIDFSSWGDNGEEAELFRQIKYGILHHRYIEIEYSGTKGETMSRRVKPLKLGFRGQAWYLFSYCEIRKDYRFFKLRRISNLKICNEQFEPEIVGKIFQEASNKWGKPPKPVTITLEIKKEIAYRAYDELANITVLENGDLQCKIDVIDTEWFLGYVFSYGAYMKVIEPEEIRQRITEQIEEMRNLYGI